MALYSAELFGKIKSSRKVPWQFQATYLYGIVEPKTGQHFFFEFSELNTDCFEVFVHLVLQQFANELLIIQLDNTATSGGMILPDVAWRVS